MFRRHIAGTFLDCLQTLGQKEPLGSCVSTRSVGHDESRRLPCHHQPVHALNKHLRDELLMRAGGGWGSRSLVANNYSDAPFIVFARLNHREKEILPSL